MGRVYLVGAGPGAADLLTVRAVRLLARADIVFHDALIEADVLALAPKAELVAVGKRCGAGVDPHTPTGGAIRALGRPGGANATSQRFINKRLIDAASQYQVVVRLKGGDPMVFGRAQEEIDALVAAGVDVEAVPGVTAALAAAADLNLSLTRRGLARSLALVTPRVGEGETPHAWAQAAAAADTAVVYMGAGEAEAVVAALALHGVPLSRPVALVENASRPDRAHLAGPLRDLPRIAARRRGGPAVIVVGEVARALAERSADEPPAEAVAGWL